MAFSGRCSSGLVFGLLLSLASSASAVSLTLFEGGGLTRGDLQLDSWDMLFDSDPVVSGITAVTKNPLVSQHSHTSNFVVQQVPEPATAALFALGLGGLALVGRRRS